MELEWKSIYGTGNEIVDAQHRYFVGLINRVSKCFSETDDGCYRERLITELVKYAEFHFVSEENVAYACGQRAQLKAHHERHHELLDELGAYVAGLHEEARTIDEFVGFLLNWFAGHTVYEDRKLFGADQ